MSRGMYLSINLCMWHACSVCPPDVPENTPTWRNIHVARNFQELMMSDEQTFTAQQLRTAQRPSLETPERHLSQLLQDHRSARKRRRAAESPDQWERCLEQQREYQRDYRQRQKAAATTEQTPGTSTEGEGASNSRGKRCAKCLTSATEKHAVKLQKKRVHAWVARSVESVQQRASRLENMRVHARETRSVESVEHRDTMATEHESTWAWE